MKDWKDSLGIGLAVALVAGLYAGVAPAAAQEDEDARRAAVRVSYPGSGGYLGVDVTDVDDERASELGMPQPRGVYIFDVVDGEPAAEAGLESGDVIVAWNGERLESVAQLRRLTGETPPGRAVDLTVLRDGAERDVTVELAGRTGFASRGGMTFISPQIDLSRAYSPSSRDARERALEVEERLRDARERAAEGLNRVFFLGGRPRLGANTQSLGDQLAEYFGVEAGVLVTSVHEDTPAAEGGLRAGDVIVGIGDEDVNDPNDLREALADVEPGEVSVRIVRDGAAQTLTVELEDREGAFRWRRGVDDPEG
ncbi:PDZ domain-containing protein [Candidatus Palauibacter sp.]|uniref:PDZ domain-containing protein n=1 Tax=Candidatus Palauibacter sp. TaxID=3101350 RepID=UPI003B5299E0